MSNFIAGWKAVEYSLLDSLDKLAKNGMKNLKALTFEKENNKALAEKIVSDTIQEDIEVSARSSHGSDGED